MFDETPLHIIAFFLFISASSLIPYLITEIRSAYGKRFDIRVSAFLLIAGEVFCLTAFFLTLLGPNNTMLAVGLALGIGLSLLHPVPAVCFFVSLLFLRPWEFLPNNPLLKVLPRLMAALTTGTWFVGILRTGKTSFVLDRSGILFTLLLGWMATSCLFSITPGASLKMFFESFSPTSVLSFLIVNSLRTDKDLQAFSRSFIVSAAGIIGVAFYTTYRDFMSGASDFRLHSSGLWGNANDLAALAVLMLPLTLITLRIRTQGLSRGAALILTAFFLGALLWSQSRAAQGAALLAGAIYLLISGSGVRLGVICAPLIVMIAVIAAAMPQRDAADTEGSSESRYNYVIAGLRMARAYPVFGVGIGNYPYLYEQFTPAFIETGNRTAHSSWVLALSETGVGGLLLLWLLFGSVAQRAWRLRSAAPHYMLSMITYGIAMSFLSHTYLFLPYVFMAFILAASRASATEVTRKQLAPGCPPLKTPSRASAMSFSNALLAVLSLLGSPSALADELTRLGARGGIEKPMPGVNDATTDAIAVRGSRGEVVTFLMRAEGTGCLSLHLNWEGIKPAQSALETSFYDLPEVTTLHPSFSGARVGSFLDPVVPIKQPASICVDSKRKSRWLLGEIRIPRDFAAGAYRLRISAGVHAVIVNVTVWPMVIPDEPALPAYSELTPWFLVLAHHGAWHPDEPKLAQAYTNAMIEHRLIPLKSIIAPLKETQDGPIRLLDLERTPSTESSFNSIVLNNRPKWSYYDFPTVGANGSTRIDYTKAEPYFSAIERTIPRVNRGGKAIVYLWDEPKKEAFPELLRLSRLVKKVAPSLKQLVTTPYTPALKDTVDIFAPVMDQFDADGFPPPSAYRELQREGREAWWYVSCMSHGCEALRDTQVPDMVIDRPSSYIRSIGWLSMRYSIDAFLYYSANNGFQYAPKRDPWESLWDFSGNGDGTLFYPGRPGERGLTAHQPITSLRLKLWRESSFDAEYIRWMNDLPAPPEWWKEGIKQLASSTTKWERDYLKYQALRDRAGEYLSSRVAQRNA